MIDYVKKQGSIVYAASSCWHTHQTIIRHSVCFATYWSEISDHLNLDKDSILSSVKPARRLP